MESKERKAGKGKSEKNGRPFIKGKGKIRKFYQNFEIDS